MKHLQLLIDDTLDAELDRRAALETATKTELVLRLVRQGLETFPPLSEDPIAAMIGVDDYEPADVDTVVYG